MPARAQLAWLLTAQPYPTGVHPRGMVSVPPCRSTSAAIAQQRVGIFRPELKQCRRASEGSMASAVSASDASMRVAELVLHFTSYTFLPSPGVYTP